jgi:hypothetical protein
VRSRKKKASKPRSNLLRKEANRCFNNSKIRIRLLKTSQTKWTSKRWPSKSWTRRLISKDRLKMILSRSFQSCLQRKHDLRKNLKRRS